MGNEPRADKKSGNFGFENFHLSQTLFSKTAASKLTKQLFNFYFLKIAKKIFLKRFRMSFPMDVEMDSFIVETSSEGEIKPSPMLVDPIYLSSDSEEEEMCTFTTGSWADDEDGLSDELQSMSVNIEHALYTGIPTRPTYAGAMVTPPPTPRRQLFQPESFNFDMGRGWIGEERKNHPIEICREIVPIRDSPASPDTPNRKPEIFRPYDLPGPSNREDMQRDQTVDLVSGHLENIRIAAPSAKPMYSDCIVCGKSYGDIVDETVRNYLQSSSP